MSVITHARRALADAIARLLARWQRRWAVTMDRLDNALNAFDSNAATATAQPKGKN